MAKKEYMLLLEIVEEVKNKKEKGNNMKVNLPYDDILRFGKRICVPNNDNLRRNFE